MLLLLCRFFVLRQIVGVFQLYYREQPPASASVPGDATIARSLHPPENSESGKEGK